MMNAECSTDDILAMSPKYATGASDNELYDEDGDFVRFNEVKPKPIKKAKRNKNNSGVSGFTPRPL